MTIQNDKVTFSAADFNSLTASTKTSITDFIGSKIQIEDYLSSQINIVIQNCINNSVDRKINTIVEESKLWSIDDRSKMAVSMSLAKTSIGK